MVKSQESECRLHTLFATWIKPKMTFIGEGFRTQKNVYSTSNALYLEGKEEIKKSSSIKNPVYCKHNRFYVKVTPFGNDVGLI